jgi:hypothetical protein
MCKHPRSYSIDSLPEPTVPVAKHDKFYHFSSNGKGWDISFRKRGEGSIQSYNVTNEFKLQTIPTIFAIVKDFYFKQDDPPDYIIYNPKAESDEATNEIDPQYKKKVIEDIKTYMKSLDSDDELTAEWNQKIITKLNTLIKHLKTSNTISIGELSILREIYYGNDQRGVNTRLPLNFVFRFVQMRVIQPTTNKRGRIYEKIIKRSFPNASIEMKKDGAYVIRPEK